MTDDERTRVVSHLKDFSGVKRPKEFSEKLSKRMSTPEAKERTKRTLVPTLFGREWSDERRKAWSEHMKGKYKGGKHVFAKAVLDTDTGKVYGSVTTAAEALGFSRPYVQRCLRGKEGRKNLVWAEPSSHDDRMDYGAPPPPRTRGCYCIETGKEWGAIVTGKHR